MRLDKFLCEMNIGSRSQVKTLIKQGTVTVNGKKAVSPEQKIDPQQDSICFKGDALNYHAFEYFMLHKPAGYVTATEDKRDKTVMELLPAERRSDLFPVGRLDKDTEGLLLITNDGDLAHRLLAPRKHVDKTYLVDIATSLTPDQIQILTEGVDIGEKHLTRPAKVKIVSEKQIELTIHEGKFHQVKRMLQAVDNQVIHLKRLTFGPLILDAQLQPGQCRPLTEQEIAELNTITQA